MFTIARILLLVDLCKAQKCRDKENKKLMQNVFMFGVHLIDASEERKVTLLS